MEKKNKMSSYHILNAIWVGVFPMLATSIVIGAICYLLCCLNQIKIKCVAMHKKRKLNSAHAKEIKRREKKERKRRRKDKEAEILAGGRNATYSEVSDEEKAAAAGGGSGELPQSNRTFASFNSVAEKNSNKYWLAGSAAPKPATSTPLHNATAKPSAPPVFFSAATRTTQFSSTIQTKQAPTADKSQLTLNPASSNSQLMFEIKEETGDDNNNLDDDLSQPDTPSFVRKKKPGQIVEPIEVRELNESPKSVYSRLQTLTRMARQKQLEREMKPVDMADDSDSCGKSKRIQRDNSDNESSSLSTYVDGDEHELRLNRSHSYNDYDDDAETDEGDVDGPELDDLESQISATGSPHQPHQWSSSRIHKPTPNYSKSGNRNEAANVLSDSSTSRRNNRTSHKKLIKSTILTQSSSSNNRQIYIASSDVDLDDNLIFNEDDNDSLSSAGGLPEPLLAGGSKRSASNHRVLKGNSSLSSSRNNSLSNFKMLKKRERSHEKVAPHVQSIDETTKSKNRNRVTREEQEDAANDTGSSLHVPMASGGLDLTGIRGIHDVSSNGENATGDSMSDIDENMVKNMLVKSSSALNSHDTSRSRVKSGGDAPISRR